MKRHPLALVLLCLLATGTNSFASASSADSVASEVTKANDEVQLATKDHDTKTMNRALTNDFVLVLSSGKLVNRAEWLDGVRDPNVKWEENKTEALTIHHYNGDCALAIGILHLRYRENKQLHDVRLRFTDAWVKQHGQWKWASSQVAHFPEPKKT